MTPTRRDGFETKRDADRAAWAAYGAAYEVAYGATVDSPSATAESATAAAQACELLMSDPSVDLLAPQRAAAQLEAAERLLATQVTQAFANARAGIRSVPVPEKVTRKRFAQTTPAPEPPAPEPGMSL